MVSCANPRRLSSACTSCQSEPASEKSAVSMANCTQALVLLAAARICSTGSSAARGPLARCAPCSSAVSSRVVGHAARTREIGGSQSVWLASTCTSWPTRAPSCVGAAAGPWLCLMRCSATRRAVGSSSMRWCPAMLASVDASAGCMLPIPPHKSRTNWGSAGGNCAASRLCSNRGSSPPTAGHPRGGMWPAPLLAGAAVAPPALAAVRTLASSPSHLLGCGRFSLSRGGLCQPTVRRRGSWCPWQPSRASVGDTV
mmetsp:Transcript_3047/g.9379  ORF Transcript_3047/g.9379 Transcript_3047/m.9379 type:complete len:256 (-) Transcript_3047:84-851(-)